MLATTNVKPVATIKQTEERIDIDVEWDADVDRKNVGGFGLKKTHMALAKRFVLAIHAGVIFSEIEIRTDVHGKTYVNSRCNVRCRTLNADLKRLGF